MSRAPVTGGTPARASDPGEEGGAGWGRGPGQGGPGWPRGPGRGGQAALTFFTDREMFSRIRSFTSRGSMAPPPPPPRRRRFPRRGPGAASNRCRRPYGGSVVPAAGPGARRPALASPGPSLRRGPAAPERGRRGKRLRAVRGGGGRN